METRVTRSVHIAWTNAKLFSLIAFCLMVLGVPMAASGQQATVVGTVTDPVGAVIPNATITATAVSTGLGRTATTTDAGQYVLPDLPIGLYNVKAEASGFSVENKN